VALLAAAAPAAGSEYSRSLAKRLEREIVYVEPRAQPRVTQRDAGDIRIRIAQKAIGRIKIAVVRAERAQDEGGASGLAHAVARDLDFRGALMVVAGGSIFTLTNHQNASQTVDAVREAFARNQGDRARQILAAVNGIAAVDPGPSADPRPGPGSAPDLTSGEDFLDDVGDTFRLAGLIVAIAIALPFVAVAVWLGLRYRRRRQEQEEDWDFAQEGLRNELIALGDEIRALDIDTSMPDANPLALSDYEAAIAQYDRANQALDRAEENPRLMVGEARTALAEGRRRIADAKARLARV
jgi:hypothetical protein